MKTHDYRRVSTVVYDPVHVNLRTTRYALYALGFREISCLSAFAEFRRRLEEACPELVIAETAADGDLVFNLVQDIRTGEVGRNPFLVTVLTSWARGRGTLERAINCGADDVIVRPFSTAFLEERLRTLVKARKTFVVTSDYIGPDRRRDPNRTKPSGPLVETPNTFKAAIAEDRGELDRVYGHVVASGRAMASERARRLALRIAAAAEIGLRELREGRSAQLDLSALERAARELSLRLSRTGAPDGARAGAALLHAAAALLEADGFTAANLASARERALRAYAVYAGEIGGSDAEAEIGAAVEGLRAAAG